VYTLDTFGFAPVIRGEVRHLYFSAVYRCDCWRILRRKQQAVAPFALLLPEQKQEAGENPAASALQQHGMLASCIV
jgi:hypothetical protein